MKISKCCVLTSLAAPWPPQAEGGWREQRAARGVWRKPGFQGTDRAGCAVGCPCYCGPWMSLSGRGSTR